MIILLAIFLVIFFTASAWVGIYAPKIVADQIQQALKVKVKLDKISLSLPCTIALEKLEIENLAQIKRISFSPNLIALLFGKVVIHGLTITEPVVYLERSANGKLNLPVIEKKPAAKTPEVYPTSLKIQGARIIFTDKKVNAVEYRMMVDKLNINISKVSLPITSLATNFSLNCQLANQAGEVFGEVDFSGWLDYLARDMDATLQIKDMEVTNFSAYYGNFISNKKLLSAKLDLTSAFKAKGNALNIKTDFNLSKLVYDENQPQEVNLDLAKNALDFFTDSRGNLRLEFDIDTRLDKPALSQAKLKSVILKAAMKNLSNQSPQQLMDKVVSVVDQYKELGEGLKAIFGK